MRYILFKQKWTVDQICFMNNVMETDATFRAFTLILRERNAVILLFIDMPLSRLR